mgnify:CR=1 FL=1
MSLLDLLWPNSDRSRLRWTVRLGEHWPRPGEEHWSAVTVVSSFIRTGKLSGALITRVNAANYPFEKENGPRYLVAAMRVPSTTRIPGPTEHLEGDVFVITLADRYVLAWEREPDGWSQYRDPHLRGAPVARAIAAAQRYR